MKYTKYIIAALAVVSSLGVAHAQTTGPNLWKANVPSSTITPINGNLQVPCANVVGGCVGGGQGLSTSSSPTFNGLSITTLNVSSSINSYQYFPSPAALNAGLAICGTTFHVSDVGTCYNDILAAATASGTEIYAQGFDYTNASWTVAFALTTNQKFVDMSCVKNATTFTWTGTGTSTFVNAGAAGGSYLGHPVPYGFNGCTFINAAGHSSNKTFAVIGGTQGAEGFRATNDRFQGWGGSGVFVFGSNTYSTDISNNQFSDNAGSITVPGGLTNSTERLNITGNQFGDNFSGIPNNAEANCIQLTNVSNMNLTDNQYDDCQVVIHSGVWKASIKGGQAEDPALAAGTHLGYPFILIDNSTSTSVSVSDMAMVHDGNSVTSTASEFISCGGSLTVSGVTAVLNGSASTSARFVTTAGADCQWTGSGIVNLGGTAFTRLDGIAATSSAQMQPSYANFVGTSTPTFSVSTGTISGTYNQFTGIQSGYILWVASNTGGTSDRFTFAHAFNSQPVCTMTSASGTNATSIIRSQVITTTTDTFSDSTAFATSSAWDFICMGNPN